MKPIDLRVLIGMPLGNAPLLIPCLVHDDPAASLAVYHDHLHCFGCGLHTRRYAGAALLLGMWDGTPENETAGVKELYTRIDNLPIYVPKQVTPKPFDVRMAKSFHRYMLNSPETMQYFMGWRGISEESVYDYQLGWTGSHFSIPVLSVDGTCIGIRFRRDDRFSEDGPKYSGVFGSNRQELYSMRRVSLLSVAQTRAFWLLEGEIDSIIGTQMGMANATMTNGAGALGVLPSLLKAMGIVPDKWIIGTDQDAAGEKAAWELKKQLGSAALRAQWPVQYKDLNLFALAGGTKDDIRLI